MWLVVAKVVQFFVVLALFITYESCLKIFHLAAEDITNFHVSLGLQLSLVEF